MRSEGGSSLRHRLKAYTGAAHERLDAVVGSHDLADRAVYRRFLLGHAAVVGPAERALEQAGVAGWLPDWPSRRRGASLRQDLAALGVTADADGPFPLGGEAEVFGALYVLEGSRLGGRVLSQRAGSSADPAVRGALRYLTHGLGERLWPTFLERLEASDDTRRRPADAEASALFVFNAFSDALNRSFA